MPDIRREALEDEADVRHVNDEAFGRKEEGVLVDKLRRRGVLNVSLIAVQDEENVGRIAFSQVTVESGGSSFETITLAPWRFCRNTSEKESARNWCAPGLKNAAVSAMK